MFMEMVHSLDALFDSLGPWWLEVCFVIAFPLGYYFLAAVGKKQAPVKKGIPKIVEVAKAEGEVKELQQQIEEAIAAGDHITALKQWRKVEDRVASSPDVLRLVVQALCTISPDTVVEEVAAHVEKHHSKLCNSKAALIILDAVGHGNPSKLLDEVCEMLRGRLAIPMTYQLYEVLLAGHAFSNNAARVDEICAEIRAIGQKLTARAYALVMKGFLCRGNLDAALTHAKAMREQGFYVPPFAVNLLFKVAAEAEQVQTVFEACLSGSISLPHETVTFALEDCLKRGDHALAASIERSLRAAGELPAGVFDPLLKLKVGAADCQALDLWEEMIKSGTKISEGFCVGLLSRSAESKFLRFAEEVTKYCREKNMMSIALYSALMKAYAYAGYYNKACDLYPEIIARGLTPDGIMYGCLMRFAVECGRTELSKELSQRAPQLDIQNYMSLIRAAGRDKDADRAFELLAKLQSTDQKIDLAIYNCVLDACACAGDLGRARELVASMRSRFGRLDIVSYNTLLKGLTSAGDIAGSYRLLSEMEADGVLPNDISFNCIINSAATVGNFKEAWRAVDKMTQRGIKPDHYTVSILLKALKKHGGSAEAKRVMGMVDDLGATICQEEVLLNTLLEVCMHLRETKRLQDLLNKFDETNTKPSQHLYGALIKASSSLRRVQKCRDYWREMVEDRAMMPNDIVLGCMLDALVCNGEVSEAVALFQEWKPKVGANMVLYSTVVKGFAAAGRAAEAMDLWREIRAEGLAMNTVVYNSLIDAQARKGATKEVDILFAAMQEDGIAPDAITYSTMVKSHCVKGDMQKALEVLSKMQAAGFVKDCVVFNTILDWCTKTNQMDVADKVLEEFEKLGIPPSNFTVGILVKMYGRRRMLEKAFEVALELPARWNFKPNPQVFTCLMSACFLNNNPARAFKVFQDLRENGADYKSYNVLLSGCLRTGKCREAAELIQEAYGLDGKKRVMPHGQILSGDILESVLQELARSGLSEEVGMPLVNSMKEAGVPVSGKTFSAAMQPQRAGRPRPTWQGKQWQQK